MLLPSFLLCSCDLTVSGKSETWLLGWLEFELEDKLAFLIGVIEITVELALLLGESFLINSLVEASALHVIEVELALRNAPALLKTLWLCHDGEVEDGISFNVVDGDLPLVFPGEFGRIISAEVVVGWVGDGFSDEIARIVGQLIVDDVLFVQRHCFRMLVFPGHQL